MRTTLAFLVALAAVAVCAAPASAITVSIDAFDSMAIDGDDGDDAIRIRCVAGAVQVTGIVAQDKGGVDIACSRPTLIAVDAKGGADELDVMEFDPADWTDSLPLTLGGGAGDDVFRMNPPALTIPPLAWMIEGGDGLDTAVIDQRANTPLEQSVLIPVDNQVTYGPEGQPDFVPWASIERVDAMLDDGPQHVDGNDFAGTLKIDAGGGDDSVLGGALADELRGGAGNDSIAGGAGDDLIDGGSGPDQVFGNAGADRLQLRDDFADTADCGADADAAVADVSDALVNCESVDLPHVDPPVEPPVIDPPPVDPPKADPPPTDPPIVQPPPVTPPEAPKPNPAVAKPGWKVDGDLTTITGLRVAGVARGSVLQLRCTGKRCPFTTKRTATVRKGAIDGLALLTKRAHKRLRAGQTLEVRVTAPGYVGKVLRYVVRKDKKPKLTTLCLPPGSSKPQTRC